MSEWMSDGEIGRCDQAERKSKGLQSNPIQPFSTAACILTNPGSKLVEARRNPPARPRVTAFLSVGPGKLCSLALSLSLFCLALPDCRLEILGIRTAAACCCSTRDERRVEADFFRCHLRESDVTFPLKWKMPHEC